MHSNDDFNLGHRLSSPARELRNDTDTFYKLMSAVRPLGMSPRMNGCFKALVDLFYSFLQGRMCSLPTAAFTKVRFLLPH